MLPAWIQNEFVKVLSFRSEVRANFFIPRSLNARHELK